MEEKIYAVETKYTICAGKYIMVGTNSLEIGKKITADKRNYEYCNNADRIVTGVDVK